MGKHTTFWKDKRALRRLDGRLFCDDVCLNVVWRLLISSDKSPSSLVALGGGL